jgi:hypothetical protein
MERFPQCVINLSMGTEGACDSPPIYRAFSERFAPSEDDGQAS